MANVEQYPQVPEWSVHDRLKKAREVGGFDSQKALAEAILTSETTVARYESGATERMKPLILRRWADVCGVSFEWLWDGTPSEGRPTTQHEEWVPDQERRTA